MTTIELMPGVTLRCYGDDRFKQGCLSFTMIIKMELRPDMLSLRHSLCGIFPCVTL